jgi:hypothetical protein
MDINYLKNKNEHVLDKNITFEEGPHIYTIDGDSDYMSVTTWNHSHFPKFDADKIIDKMMNGRNWKSSKYFGKTKELIKKEWDDNKNHAADAGTKMHYDIECFYNNNKVVNNSIEYTYFQEFLKDTKDLIPYRTEWMIYDKELKLAGSVDMVYENPDGTLMIYDWKRCKEIKRSNSWQSANTACISHIPDCNFWHYSLQLNTYKTIIEKNYNKKISKMFLICMHPDNFNNSYLEFEVNTLDPEIKNLFELRKKMLC